MNPAAGLSDFRSPLSRYKKLTVEITMLIEYVKTSYLSTIRLFPSLEIHSQNVYFQDFCPFNFSVSSYIFT